MDTREWLAKWTSRADIAAAGLGYAAGFAVDVFFFSEGVPPATTAGVYAVGAVGLRNAIQAFLDERRQRHMVLGEQRKLNERVTIFREHLINEGFEPLAKDLSRDIRLWEENLLTDDDLRQVLDKIVGEYRASGSSDHGPADDQP